MKNVRFRGATYKVPGQIKFRNRVYKLLGTGEYKDMLKLIKTSRKESYSAQFRFIKLYPERTGRQQITLPAVYGRKK